MPVQHNTCQPYQYRKPVVEMNLANHRGAQKRETKGIILNYSRKAVYFFQMICLKGLAQKSLIGLL